MNELQPPDETISLIEQLEAREPRPSQPLLAAVQAWDRLVDEIGHYRGSLAYEYLNDLGSRTVVSLWLSWADGDGLEELLEWIVPIVDEIDSRYRAKSQPDNERLNWDANRHNPHYWWLRRLPDDEGLLNSFRSSGPEMRKAHNNLKVTQAGIDVVAVSGKVTVNVHLTGDDDRVPVQTSGSTSVIRSIADRVLGFVPEPELNDFTGLTQPNIAIEVGSLDSVMAASEATLIITGAQDHLKIEALNYGTIDASDLSLRTAAVDLELSEVTISATESVSGFAAYLSKLTVAGGADVSGVKTPNAGRLVIEPPS